MSYGFRLTVALAPGHRLGHDEPKCEISFPDPVGTVLLKGLGSDTISEAAHLAFIGSAFDNENLAWTTGRILKNALRLAAVSSHLPLDVGQDCFRGGASPSVKERVAEDGVQLLDDIHGLQVYEETGEPVVLTMNASLTSVTDYDRFVGMKAQVVAFDRELCTLYEVEIARLLAESDSGRETAVVMTVGTTKTEPAEWRERYELSREAEAALVARYKSVDDPLSLLIVTAKLLTGFDAPIEGAMYLDKPLRAHTLFQAICRTNRRWTNSHTGQEKYFGLIVDYVGLGNEIAGALRRADPEHGGRRPVDVAGILDEFERALATALARFEGIDRTDNSFETLHAAQERIPPGDDRDAFAAGFVAAQTLWEFLDPDPALDAHRADYRWLAQVYESVQPTGVADAILWHRLGAKTLELVHGHITDLRVTGTGLDEVIVDAETLEAIRQLAFPDTANPQAETITVGEALDTIEARLQRRLASNRRASHLRGTVGAPRTAPPSPTAAGVSLRRVPQGTPRPRPAGDRHREARRGGPSRRPRSPARSQARGPDSDLPGVRPAGHASHPRRGRGRHRHHRPPSCCYRLVHQPTRRPHRPPGDPQDPQEVRAAPHG